MVSRWGFHAEPALAVTSVTPHATSAVAHLNLTAPGTLLCAYAAPSQRPAVAERAVRHAGHASLLLPALAADTRYSLDCSLHSDARTVAAPAATFLTAPPHTPRLTVTDLAASATFARVRLHSDAPGVAYCLPHRARFGRPSWRAFLQRAQRLRVGVAGRLHPVPARRR